MCTTERVILCVYCACVRVREIKGESVCLCVCGPKFSKRRKSLKQELCDRTTYTSFRYNLLFFISGMSLSQKWNPAANENFHLLLKIYCCLKSGNKKSGSHCWELKQISRVARHFAVRQTVYY